MIISYIIPVYNEIKTISESIDQIINLDFQNKEIIIIDNGSTDGTKEKLKKYIGLKDIKVILRDKNLGFGASIVKGFEEASGEFIYIQYADLEYDHLCSVKMLNLARENNADLILGSRLKKFTSFKGLINEVIKKPAYFATIICTFLINIFYKKKFTDIIGGKFYKTESIKKIILDMKLNSGMGHSFDFELVSRICKNNLKIEETNIEYKARKFTNVEKLKRVKEKKINFVHILPAIFTIIKIKLFN